MKTTLIARGQLHHHFWGEYCADIVLRFESPEDAKTGCSQINSDKNDKFAEPKFQVWDKYPDSIFIKEISSEELGNLETLFSEKYGAEEKKIASLAKSVDRGEPFTLTINAENQDPNQIELPFKKR